MDSISLFIGVYANESATLYASQNYHYTKDYENQPRAINGKFILFISVIFKADIDF